MKTKIYIKEHSIIAKIAAQLMKEKRLALVINKTIYLYNVSKNDFLQHPTWLAHELVHVQQYQRLGLLKFLFLYLVQSMKNGYQNNLYEKEAVCNETDLSIINNFEIG